ncbi:MAG: hypothetical protein Q9191_000301 [Dirinaria sp. TL-2023a]
MTPPESASIQANDARPDKTALPQTRGDYGLALGLPDRASDEGEMQPLRHRSARLGTMSQEDETEREARPPLPPRPAAGSNLRVPKSSRPPLQSSATIALSLTDIHTQSYQDGSRETFAAQAEPATSGKYFKGFDSIRNLKDHKERQADSSSVRSYAPTLEAGADVESLLGEIIGRSSEGTAWRLQGTQTEELGNLGFLENEDEEMMRNFDHEFDEIEQLSATAGSEEQLLRQWKAKRKHFLILSSAGKPVYNRHGDDNLISSFIGIIQTIISFFEGAHDQLRGFTAGGSRFVVMSQGPLYLAAISRLGENDNQLRLQLEALYMQILSTLTLPTLNHLFSNRPSTDLRRPLQGTEPLLSALADEFTRGSSSSLLSAVECLKLRKSHRQSINNTMLQSRCDSLLYGMIVARGRLVSVVRPRRHSLHPGDLQLIFNMLFEADGVKAGGGENWIPLCLPGFNKTGYLYMYVSWVENHCAGGIDAHGKHGDHWDHKSAREDEVVILLISAKKESFYELREMRDSLVKSLNDNGSLEIIRSAVLEGRLKATDIVPGTVLRHFLFKSRANVQFVMPSYEPYFASMVARRRLLSLYQNLHGNVHAKNAHLKVHHFISRSAVSLAWVTPQFEMYCVAGPNTSRNALAQSANKVIQWVRREEERVFIIGGAVF